MDGEEWTGLDIVAIGGLILFCCSEMVVNDQLVRLGLINAIVGIIGSK